MDPAGGDRARLWERLSSRRLRKGEGFFSLAGTRGLWGGSEADSGVVLPDLRGLSVTMVGCDGVSFLVFRKPDRRRSIVWAVLFVCCDEDGREKDKEKEKGEEEE